MQLYNFVFFEGELYSLMFLSLFTQDRSMSLEPHEFKMCLISLNYNLKEGEKVTLRDALRRFYPFFHKQ